jgi:starch synthase
MKILFVTPECAPMVKTGGLGDVSAALPRALRALGHDVVVLMPAYGNMAAELRLQQVVSVPADGAWPASQLLQTTAPDGLPLWLLSCPGMYTHAGSPYGDAKSHAGFGQAIGFGLLSRVAALLGTRPTLCEWQADIVQANDWPCGLTPLYLHQARSNSDLGTKVARSVMTIHNLAFQGVYPMAVSDALDISPAHRGIDGVEYWGQLSMLKAGLQFADAITTVSPTYAREIQQPSLGFGLDGVLRSRAEHLHGILNGIDTDVWNPGSDPLIAAPYTADTLDRKLQNKEALRTRLAMRSSAGPLLGFVGRLTGQKGVDLILNGAPRFLAAGAQLVVLGRGEESFERGLTGLAAAHPGQVHVTLGFDESLAHGIEAGADCFLMPSRFEPCGLNQMYSQAYGTPPVVNRTGGLADTVVDAGPDAAVGTGFVMAQATQAEFDGAVARMLEAWQQPAFWRALQMRGMQQDFSWMQPAARYEALGQSLLERSDTALARQAAMSAQGPSAIVRGRPGSPR